jgi:hypothetical protein
LDLTNSGLFCRAHAAHHFSITILNKEDHSFMFLWSGNARDSMEISVDFLTGYT